MRFFKFLWNQKARIIVYSIILISLFPYYSTIRVFSKHNSVDPAFQVYYDKMEKMLAANGMAYLAKKRVPIQFANGLGEHTLGVSYYPVFGNSEIEVDIKKWNTNMDETGRAFLIYHELGHIMCNIHTHLNGNRKELGFICPNSLMNWQMPSKFCRDSFYDDYLNSLMDACRMSITRDLEP